MASWNSREILPPPWVTLPVEKAAAKNDVYKSTWELLQYTAEYWTKHIPFLTTELQLLDKIIYKQNQTLRREKLMCYLKQMNKCLTRFMEVDFGDLINNIADSWPSPDEVRIAARHVYVPSRQQIDYTMVRMVGVAHLLQQAANYALQAFEQAMVQIQIGMIAHNMVVFCATTSRIWFLCHSFRKYLAQLYDQLQSIAANLEATKVEWTKVSDLPKSLIGDIAEFTQLETKMKNKKSNVDKLLERFDFSGKTVNGSSLSSNQEEPEDDKNKLGESIEISDDFALKRTERSEDMGVRVKRGIRSAPSKEDSKKDVKKRKDTADLMEDDIWQEVMDVTNIEGVYEENEDYRQPMATSTPAPNHPNFGNHVKSDSVPLLGDLTEINEEKEETFNTSADFNVKKLRLKVKKCKSIPKLLTIITNNKSTIERTGEEKFEQCVRKIRKIRKKARDEVDQKERLLKKAKSVLTKELGLDSDDSEPETQEPKVVKRIFVVADKTDLKRVLSDSLKKQKKVLATLLENKGKFKVAGKMYQMRPASLESFNAVVRKLCMKQGSNRTNVPAMVNKLVSIFKREIAAASSDDSVSKVSKKINSGKESQMSNSGSFQISSEMSVNKKRKKRKGKKN